MDYSILVWDNNHEFMPNIDKGMKVRVSIVIDDKMYDESSDLYTYTRKGVAEFSEGRHQNWVCESLEEGVKSFRQSEVKNFDIESL